MKSPIKLALLTTTALGFAGSAYAADLYADYTPPSDVSYVPKAETPFTWSGVYFGGHVGGAWTDFNAIDDVCSIYGPGEDKIGGGFDSICDLAEGSGTVSDANSMFDGETVDYFLPDTSLFLEDNALVFDQHRDDGGFDWIYGGQVGINQQYGNLVLGLEADISGLGGGTGTTVDYFEHFTSDSLTDNLNQTVTLTSESDIKWLATFRGRAGVAMGRQGRLLPYVTGGAAVAQVENMYSGVSADVDGGCTGGCGFNLDGENDVDFKEFSTSETDYEFGFAVGVGAEYAFTDYISFGLEYLFVGFPNSDGTNSVFWVNENDVGFTHEQESGIDNVQMVRAKLNFRFPPRK